MGKQFWAIGLLAGFSACILSAQSFEVASIKPCKADARAGRGSSAGSPDRLDLGCRTVFSILETAYTSGMPPLPPIEGGPAWIHSESYAIEAKAEGSPGAAAMRGPMLQALLRDRFQLRAHLETREVQAYFLTVAKGGPKLKSHSEGTCVDIGLVKPLAGPRPPRAPGERPVFCGANHSGKGTGADVTLDVAGVTLEYFARTFLGISFWGHPVIDKTGISGLFDIHLEFARDESTPGPPGTPPPSEPGSGPTIFAALEQQLGLKLESGKGPREVLIIDRIERPSAN